MSLALAFAACLSALAAPATAQPRSAQARPVDRSQSEQDRLNELQLQVRSAREKGEIDRATAKEFYLSIGRIRRQMILMGIQVGYRQRLRLRARVDRLHAQWEGRRRSDR